MCYRHKLHVLDFASSVELLHMCDKYVVQEELKKRVIDKIQTKLFLEWDNAVEFAILGHQLTLEELLSRAINSLAKAEKTPRNGLDKLRAHHPDLIRNYVAAKRKILRARQEHTILNSLLRNRYDCESGRYFHSLLNWSSDKSSLHNQHHHVVDRVYSSFRNFEIDYPALFCHMLLMYSANCHSLHLTLSLRITRRNCQLQKLKIRHRIGNSWTQLEIRGSC